MCVEINIKQGEAVMLLSIIIPCYIEEKNIPLLLSRFSEVIKERQDIEVLLVDNGSTDNSAEVLNRLIGEYSFARKVTVEVNQGYGYGILSGLAQAKGDFLGWTHADMQTDPLDVVKAVDIIKKNKCKKNIYVKGKRRGRSLFDLVFTWGMGVLETLYLGEKLSDINAQPNMFSRSFYEKWIDPPYDFSLDLYAFYLARKKHCRLIRFDVFFPKRIHGESKWNTGFKSKLKFIKRTLDFSVSLKNRIKSNKGDNEV